MKLLIATPVYNNNLDSRMVSSVIGVIGECFKRNISVNWDRPCSAILSYNRNVSAQKAIDEDFDWLLYWDADISVDSATFPFEMIELAAKTDIPVVALPVCLKSPYEKKYNFAQKIGDAYINAKEMPEKPELIDVVGTGVFLVKTSILRELEPPWFHFTDTYDKGRVGFFPEDWYFCEKVGKILLDPRFDTTHYGSYPYR